MPRPTVTLKADPLPWLLEPDPVNPGVRSLVLRDLLVEAETARKVRAA